MIVMSFHSTLHCNCTIDDKINICFTAMFKPKNYRTLITLSSSIQFYCEISAGAQSPARKRGCSEGNGEALKIMEKFMKLGMIYL